MKTHKMLLSLVVLAGLAINAHAAISVPAGGTTPNTFPARPTVAEGWSTLSIGTASGNVTTAAELDGAVQNLAAASIATELGSSPTVPPSANIIARFHTANLNIQTRPTDNDFLVLMATLQNDTGSDATSLNVVYDLGRPTGIAGTDVIPGHRVYFSLTGAANSWQLVNDLTTGTPGALNATFSVGTWPAGGTLYLLWADDNSGGTDYAYTIDNIAFTASAAHIPLACILTAPAADQTVPAPATIALAATATGTTPASSVSFYTNGVLYVTDSVPPFADTLTGLPAGTYAINATAENGGVDPVATSATNTITVTNVPLTVTLTAPANGTYLTAPANVPVTATSSGTIPPTSVAFYVNDTLSASFTAAPYSNQLTALPVGTYAIYATADNGVETAYSATNTVTVREEFVSYTGGTLTENFDSMGTAGTVTPVGWYVGWGTPINTSIVTVGDGSAGPSGAAAGWNYGTTGDSDRALGTIPTGTGAPQPERNIAVRIQNNTGNGITSFEFHYTGEVWRNYTNVYGILTNYVSYDGTTWTPIPFGFAQPFAPAQPMTALDGNLPANRTLNIGGVVTPPATVPPGGVIYLRWQDPNDSGTDGALAIDDFTFTGSGALMPVTITTEPTSVFTLADLPVSFTVVAAGTDPSYFWFHDSALVSTAGASYNIASAQASDAGSYYVIVSNSVNTATSAVVSLTVTQQANWVAFNAQLTANTSVTRYTPAGAPTGPLTNVLVGNRLHANLTIVTNDGAVANTGTMGTPAAGTPADTLFTPYVSWTGGNAGLGLRTTGVVSYVFTGLDTAKTYKFAGTSVRAGGTGNDYSNRWIQVELQGATAYATNHTAGVITADQYPGSLTGNQVAFNCGMNNTNLAGLPTGDVVEWVSIVPSAGPGNAPTNGTFTVVVKQYTNATPYMPAGITPVPTTVYSLGQIRLEQSVPVAANPPLTVVQMSPTEVMVSWGADAVGYTLQQNTTDVGNPVGWSNVGVAITAAGSHMMTFPPPDRAFFRLIK